MFFGDWLQRREMLSPNKVALFEAFIPVPDPKWGEVGRAIIVLKPGASLTQADLINWLCDQTAHYKVPKSVVFADTLPKTVANKVDKGQLIEQYGS